MRFPPRKTPGAHVSRYACGDHLFFEQGLSAAIFSKAQSGDCNCIWPRFKKHRQAANLVAGLTAHFSSRCPVSPSNLLVLDAKASGTSIPGLSDYCTKLCTANRSITLA